MSGRGLSPHSGGDRSLLAWPSSLCWSADSAIAILRNPENQSAMIETATVHRADLIGSSRCWPRFRRPEHRDPLHSRAPERCGAKGLGRRRGLDDPQPGSRGRDCSARSNALRDGRLGVHGTRYQPGHCRQAGQDKPVASRPGSGRGEIALQAYREEKRSRPRHPTWVRSRCAGG